MKLRQNRPEVQFARRCSTGARSDAGQSHSIEMARMNLGPVSDHIGA
jgi:hypothetical protein